MSEHTIDYDFSLQHCPTCSVPFILPELDLQNRQDTGRSFYCPSGHEIKATPEGRLAGLQWQLEQALGLAKDEQVRRAAAERELQRILDEAEESGEVEQQEAIAPAPAAPTVVEHTDVPLTNWRDGEKTCEECGKVFRPKASHNEHMWRIKKFCSHTCATVRNARKTREKAEAKKAEQKVQVDEPEEDPESRPLIEPVPDAIPANSGLMVPMAPETRPLEAETLIAELPVLSGQVSAESPMQDVQIPEPVQATVSEAPTKDPRIGRAPRPVKQPSSDPPKRQPPPPPSQQAKLPDPREQSDYQPVGVGATIERLDNGNCEECGQPLNAFKVCGNCKRRKEWLKGQMTAKVKLST